MEETIIKKKPLKPVYTYKRKKKKPQTIVKVMIYKRKSKRTNMKMLKKDLKLIECGRTVRKSTLFFLEYI